MCRQKVLWLLSQLWSWRSREGIQFSRPSCKKKKKSEVRTTDNSNQHFVQSEEKQLDLQCKWSVTVARKTCHVGRNREQIQCPEGNYLLLTVMEKGNTKNVEWAREFQSEQEISQIKIKSPGFKTFTLLPLQSSRKGSVCSSVSNRIHILSGRLDISWLRRRLSKHIPLVSKFHLEKAESPLHRLSQMSRLQIPSSPSSHICPTIYPSPHYLSIHFFCQHLRGTQGSGSPS